MTSERIKINVNLAQFLRILLTLLSELEADNCGKRRVAWLTT